MTGKNYPCKNDAVIVTSSLSWLAYCRADSQEEKEKKHENIFFAMKILASLSIASEGNLYTPYFSHQPVTDFRLRSATV